MASDVKNICLRVYGAYYRWKYFPQNAFIKNLAIFFHGESQTMEATRIKAFDALLQV